MARLKRQVKRDLQKCIGKRERGGGREEICLKVREAGREENRFKVR